MGLLKDNLNNKDIPAEERLAMLKVHCQQSVIFEAHALQRRLDRIGEKGIRIVVVTTDNNGNDHIVDPANRLIALPSIPQDED